MADQLYSHCKNKLNEKGHVIENDIMKNLRGQKAQLKRIIIHTKKHIKLILCFVLSSDTYLILI